MMKTLIDIFQSLPSPLATFLIAMLPVGELRGAIPVAILVYKIPWPLAMVIAIAGNMLPVYFLLLFFEAVTNWLMQRFHWAKRLFDWLFERTRRKLNKQVKKYGYWALAIFVAIPLPATGAWTGAMAAFVFGLPEKKSFLAILLGVCLAAIIVTLVTIGGNAAVMKLFLIK
ncbi:MAG: hypothetical protein A3E37_05240 [Candidatus Andersenbacteria bacterium RIFCSPHIGHO2_12_FULL_46_9]|nr:MAG: hypothetical protein UW94_C0008G0049 [Parcubacteria group bacterium GW2011_GWA2_45_14]OGY35648.1 MAG: hypothetical protein A3B76_05385 [Candidatus Andersenbacteria bacterium RIFCSPHIGHO2_02_FULL_46_16]OGY36850.1 MAG: hypothetical protein A3I08_03215 [Candidatus Andersenbacteria bacterium RIFCSPLOWO2_02_FULL_46_11]OGY38454.1 MAG: hypothetical protein A3E37_05240 [Candidatus Andersenbacteria bacterium RIFCSPHIGHO2_12_FULL_46_9]OGY41650.1 MAG: hypothetical protein A3G57_02120 [Candidatus A